MSWARIRHCSEKVMKSFYSWTSRRSSHAVPLQRYTVCRTGKVLCSGNGPPPTLPTSPTSFHPASRTWRAAFGLHRAGGREGGIVTNASVLCEADTQLYHKRLLRDTSCKLHQGVTACMDEDLLKWQIGFTSVQRRSRLNSPEYFRPSHSEPPEAYLWPSHNRRHRPAAAQRSIDHGKSPLW